MSCKLQNIFLWFLKVSWIARGSKITFLKFYKSWDVFQASKYFAMIFKSFLDCQNVQDNFQVFSNFRKCLLILEKLFWSFGDFVWLPEILEKHSAPSWSTGVFVNTWKNILKLWGFCMASRISRKMFCNFRSGSTGVFVNTWKNILKFWNFVGLLEILEKCLATSESTGVFVNTWKNILKLWGFCRASRNSRKMFSNFWKYWSVCKYLKKYSEALGILYGF